MEGYASGLIGGIISKRATANSRRSRIIQIAHFPTMIALILCVIGGIDESHTSSSDVSTGKKYTKIGIVIFVFIFLLLVTLTAVTMKDVGNAPRGEKRIYVAVLAAIPLLAVRLLYSILAAFSHDPDFSVTRGKPYIQLFMAVIEEFLIVCFYTGAGLTVART